MSSLISARCRSPTIWIIACRLRSMERSRTPPRPAKLPLCPTWCSLTSLTGGAALHRACRRPPAGRQGCTATASHHRPPHATSTGRRPCAAAATAAVAAGAAAAPSAARRTPQPPSVMETSARLLVSVPAAAAASAECHLEPLLGPGNPHSPAQHCASAMRQKDFHAGCAESTGHIVLIEAAYNSGRQGSAAGNCRLALITASIAGSDRVGHMGTRKPAAAQLRISLKSTATF